MDRKTVLRLFKKAFPSFTACRGGFWIAEGPPLLRGFVVNFKGPGADFFQVYSTILALFNSKSYIYFSYGVDLTKSIPSDTYDVAGMLAYIQKAAQRAHSDGMLFLEHGATVERFAHYLQACQYTAGDPNRGLDLAYAHLWLEDYNAASPILHSLVADYADHETAWVKEIAEVARSLLNDIGSPETIRSRLEANCQLARKSLGLK